MSQVIFRRKLLGTLALVLLAAGCGGGGTSAPPPSFDGGRERALTITIRNQQLDAARVTLWISNMRRRLGDVQGNATRTFRVPMPSVDPVRMSFDLLLGATCITGEMILGPGDEIETIIPSNLSLMQAVCRR
jgi:hypothetical protein